MASYETFFPENGSSYPFEQPYGGFVGSKAYHPSVRDMAYPTDPLTANQLKKVSDKINTGAQTIEVSGLGLTGAGPMKHLASIPKQHWKEIDRLRQLTGVELTFHGPLVESTGFSRGNWSEEQRLEAEKQMKAAVDLAQQMNSNKNDKKGVVMTFHSNNGLPEVERKIMVEDEKGNRKEELASMSVYNPWTGEIGTLPFNKRYDNFEKKEENVESRFKEFNKERWNNKVEAVVVNSTRVNREVFDALTNAKEEDAKIKEIAPEYSGSLFDGYKVYNKNYEQYQKDLSEISKQNPEVANKINNGVSNLQNAEFFINESYEQFKELYNQAYTDAQKEIQFTEKKEIKEAKEKALKKLDKYAEELKNTFGKFKNEYNFVEIQNKINEGTRLLKDDDVRPALYRPLKEFAIDKSSDTFANVALHAYQNAKKNGIAPGIISIENPPAGMSGLTRAEELAALVEASRKKFVKNAVDKKIMSESEAKKTAEQIIGATWDVGHINSIQKWGYNKQDVLGQAQKISKYVKHMHIADNLGFEDAELPIGMGNVPIDEILNNPDWGENFRKAKKAIETGDWFSRQGGLGMTKTPVVESLSGLTAPVYSSPSMDSGAYWNNAVMNDGGYFGGLGPINPEGHHSMYGAGFSQLPAYLGAEMPGKATNSSFSGAPLE
jgi:sugar phosphate isomerase/epimerase